ncbi:MAG: hypothetical protein WBG36_09140 [Ornithinimicrobium sp.]
MNVIRRIVISACAVAALTASHVVPAAAATTTKPEIEMLQIDPCALLGPFLGDRC